MEEVEWEVDSPAPIQMSVLEVLELMKRLSETIGTYFAEIKTARGVTDPRVGVTFDEHAVKKLIQQAIENAPDQ